MHESEDDDTPKHTEDSETSDDEDEDEDMEELTTEDEHNELDTFKSVRLSPSWNL